MPGRVRGVDANRRIAIDRGWEVAPSPAGAIDDPKDIDGLDWIGASVPTTAAGALRAAKRWSWDDNRKFDAEDWWWRVRVDGEFGPRILGLDGLATLCDVWWKGTKIASTDNMFVAHEIAVDATDSDELVIRCRALETELAKKRPRPRWRVPMLDNQQLRWIRTTLLGRTPGWSPPCPAVGPWRPVWIEERTLDTSGISLSARLDGEVGLVEVRAPFDGTIIIGRSGRAGETVRAAVTNGKGKLAIHSPARWWPHTHGEPALYDVWIQTAKATVDLGSIGFRTLAFQDGGFVINGVPIFARGACWTPLDAVTLAASPSGYDAAIAQAKACGMNMIRVGGTMVYEDDAFLDALDREGILLWQDLMFANMDYPDELVPVVETELDQQLSRLQARPSLAMVCGNSEGGQQAAMAGATRDRWEPKLFHDTIASKVKPLHVPYVPSSTHAGAFPHQPKAGVASYYGVGAYLRPLEDARRSGVRFASECLGFANIGEIDPTWRVHHAAWKRRAPRDLGAGWDFDDVRDHYVELLYGVDPTAVRYHDHDRYLALGRAATGDVMAQTFHEWRRARSVCRGGLVWFLRDLWPGAGWGVIESSGTPKPCWHALRRALAPIAIAITDEGNNGLALHAINDAPTTLAAKLELVLYRSGEVEVGRGSMDITVPAHGAIEVDAATLFEGWSDLSFAYRFGPPTATLVHASLVVDDAPIAEAFAFPAGQPSERELDIGLATTVEPLADNHFGVTITTRRFAQAISIEVPHYTPDDTGFHLAPGASKRIVLSPNAGPKPMRGSAVALNAETSARIIPP